MKIFWSFLIVLTGVLLWVIPFTSAAHDFQTDLREDIFTVTTGDTTNATVQLFKELYDDDTSSISLYSHDADDSPLYYSYNTTTRAMVVVGLAGNTTRQLDVTYDIDALNDDTLATLAGTVAPWLWIAVAVVFPPGALFALWFGKRDV